MSEVRFEKLKSSYLSPPKMMGKKWANNIAPADSQVEIQHRKITWLNVSAQFRQANDRVNRPFACDRVCLRTGSLS
jgi:hypothetical protein